MYNILCQINLNVLKFWAKNLEKKIYTQFSLPKCLNISILCTTDAHFYNPSVKISYVSFFHILSRKISTIFEDATLLALVIYLSLFKCFTFFKFDMPSQISHKSNSIRIIFIIILLRSILRMPLRYK